MPTYLYVLFYIHDLLGLLWQWKQEMFHFTLDFWPSQWEYQLWAQPIMTILGLPHSTVREIKIGRSFEFGRLTPMQMNRPSWLQWRLHNNWNSRCAHGANLTPCLRRSQLSLWTFGPVWPVGINQKIKFAQDMRPTYVKVHSELSNHHIVEIMTRIVKHIGQPFDTHEMHSWESFSFCHPIQIRREHRADAANRDTICSFGRCSLFRSWMEQASKLHHRTLSLCVAHSSQDLTSRRNPLHQVVAISLHPTLLSHPSIVSCDIMENWLTSIYYYGTFICARIELKQLHLPLHWMEQ